MRCTKRGLPADWRCQPVGDARGMALHESQSLLVEMQACRSRAVLSPSPRPRCARPSAGDGDGLWRPDNLAPPLHRGEPRLHPRRCRRGHLSRARHPALPAGAGADRGRPEARRPAGRLERGHEGAARHRAARRPLGLPAGHPLVRRRLRLFPDLYAGRDGRGAAVQGGARGRCVGAARPSRTAISSRSMPG